MDDVRDLDIGGPDDRMLNWREVQAIVGLSRTTVWRLQQIDAFPKPVSLSPGRVCWWETEVMAWRRSRTTAAFRPPERPRLPGMPRRPKSGPVAQAADRKPEPAPPAPEVRVPSRGRGRSVASNQSDFGF